MCNNVISCKNYQAGGDNMKFQIEKQVLGVLNKIVSKNVKNEKSGPPYCPVIFHQPKRPEKRKK